jgi:rod shape-determining protein MreD
LFPFTLTLLLIMVGMVPLRIPDLSPIIPSLGLVAVYYWAIYRPDLLPAWAVFAVGLIQDLLGGGPLGVNAAVFLIAWAVIGTQRRLLITGSFALVWAVFLPAGAFAFLLNWLFNCMIEGALIQPEPAVFQYLTTVAVYPCLAWIFAQAPRAVLR